MYVDFVSGPYLLWLTVASLFRHKKSVCVLNGLSICVKYVYECLTKQRNYTDMTINKRFNKRLSNK